MLLNVIEEFSNWSGMEVKIVKSCGMWAGAERDLKLPLTLVFRGQQLRIVPRDDPVRYLGFFQSPDGDWKDMVRRVLEETRKACDKLELHPLNADEAANLAQTIVISTFRRPAALVPWANPTVRGIQQLRKNSIQTIRDIADVLRHIIKNISERLFGNIQSPAPVTQWECFCFF
jgi:hypothetical protein